MKIKEVCAKTGLSDKTIRYYIRSGLIFPKYNENYTGRKNFEFSEKDIERLNQVVVLRKYNFSINSIKTIFDDNQSINAVVKTHIENMREESQNSFQLLSMLNTILNNDFSNAADLCAALSKTECMPQAVPSTDNKTPYKILYFKNKKAAIILAILLAAMCTTCIVHIFSSFAFGRIFDRSTPFADSGVIINGETYTAVNGGWVPYQNVYADDEFYLYARGSKTVFAKSKSDKLFDGVVYHNTNDVYPDISEANKIGKIVLTTDKEQILLNNEMAMLLTRELSDTSISDESLSEADISTAEIYVNVYYKEYPAYQNEFVLCYSKHHELGFMYCETEKNDNKLSKGGMKLFADNRLISYIESLDLIG